MRPRCDGGTRSACYHRRGFQSPSPTVAAMPLDIVVIMDPIGSIKIAKDSTFAILLEAQRRGHRLWYVLPGGLGARGDAAVARMAGMRVHDAPGHWFDLGPPSQIEMRSGHMLH